VEDYFLKIDGIPGESQDAKHKGEIQLVAFSWGVSESGGAAAGGGAGAGKARFEDFHFVMRTNKASPQLFLACASGKHLKEANLTVRHSGARQLEYLKIKLSDVLVSSFDEAGGEETVEESVSLAFGRLEVQYTPLDAAGAPASVIKVGWDISRNAKI
jgi:type VI secretion system secreted protein Hcp